MIPGHLIGYRVLACPSTFFKKAWRQVHMLHCCSCCCPATHPFPPLWPWDCCFLRVNSFVAYISVSLTAVRLPLPTFVALVPIVYQLVQLSKGLKIFFFLSSSYSPLEKWSGLIRENMSCDWTASANRWHSGTKFTASTETLLHRSTVFDLHWHITIRDLYLEIEPTPFYNTPFCSYPKWYIWDTT